jgi:hypothetical protein
VSRLIPKLSRNGFGNALSDRQLRRLYGGRWSGPNAGVVIDGVIYPVQGQPPRAETHGWGVVPGSKV